MNDSNSGELFMKIFKNVFLKQKIFEYIRYYNQVLFYSRYYSGFDKFRRSNIKDKVSKVLISKLSGTSSQEFIDFIKNDITSNITSLKFMGGNGYRVFLVKLKDLYIPETVKYLDIATIDLISDEEQMKQYQQQQKSSDGGIFSSMFNLLKNKNNSNNNNNNNNNQNSFITINNNHLFTLNNHNNITHLYITNLSFNSISKFRFYPPNLVHLSIIGSTREIGKGDLPDSLYSLKIIPEYKHPYISLPSKLKKLWLGEGYLSSIQESCIDSFPSSLTSIKLLAPNHGNIKPFKSELAQSLRKLVFVYDYNEPEYLNGTLNSLTHLDISKIYRYTKLNLSLFPSTIKVLKLPHMLRVNNISDTPCGFPESLTHLEGSSSLLTLKFQNPSNLQYLYFKTILDNFNNFINFDLFPNIKSIQYDSLRSVDNIYIPSPPPNKLLNLEISCISNFISNSLNQYHNSSLKPLESLICLKLDKEYSSFLLLNNPSPSSPLPKNLKLLELEFEANTQNLTLSKEILPSSLQVLIIKGTNLPIIEPSSLENIQHVFISSNLKPKLKRDISNDVYRKINFVRPLIINDLKFYKKFKKQYIENNNHNNNN